MTILRTSMESVTYVCVCACVCELYRRRSAGRDADSVFGMSVEHVQLGRGLTAQPIE